MALADISERPGLLLGAAIVLHVALISAQVNTVSGLPVLQVVTFGSFAELQRLMTGGLTGAQDLWTGYIDLRHVRRSPARRLDGHWRREDVLGRLSRAAIGA